MSTSFIYIILILVGLAAGWLLRDWIEKERQQVLDQKRKQEVLKSQEVKNEQQPKIDP